MLYGEKSMEDTDGNIDSNVEQEPETLEKDILISARADGGPCSPSVHT